MFISYRVFQRSQVHWHLAADSQDMECPRNNMILVNTDFPNQCLFWTLLDLLLKAVLWHQPISALASAHQWQTLCKTIAILSLSDLTRSLQSSITLKLNRHHTMHLLLEHQSVSDSALLITYCRCFGIVWLPTSHPRLQAPALSVLSPQVYSLDFWDWVVYIFRAFLQGSQAEMHTGSDQVRKTQQTRWLHKLILKTRK